MTLSNTHTTSHTGSATEASADTDGNGDVEVTIPELRRIESAADANAHAAGGYVASVQSVSGNTVTVRVFQEADAGGELTAVTGTADVTDIHVNAEGY